MLDLEFIIETEITFLCILVRKVYLKFCCSLFGVIRIILFSYHRINFILKVRGCFFRYNLLQTSNNIRELLKMIDYPFYKIIAVGHFDERE